jgi:hypothetical protein
MDSKIAEMIAGYGRAADFLETERRQRLAVMTPEDARTIFTDLLQTGQNYPARAEKLENLEAWRLETVLILRQAFLKLYQVRSRG